MTSRERLIAAARGGEVDRKPVISYPMADDQSDALVLNDPDEIRRAANGERLVLAEVLGAFARCGPETSRAFEADPVTSAEKLDSAVAQVREETQNALAAGADGILYRLHGARARYSTPMQYGGIYLERDRELLQEIEDAALNVLLLVGDDDLYLDFVSDLPAHVIAWDADTSGITSADVRSLRSGAQASADPASDILLRHPGVCIADELDRF